MEAIQSHKIDALHEWKRLYEKELIDHLKPTGNVLQIGFDSGQAAEYIQSFHPKSHTIIESDPAMLAQAKIWASKHPQVKIEAGSWEKVLHHLGEFDAVFFNQMSSSEQGDFLKRCCPEVAKESSKEGKTLLEKLQRKFESVKKKFTDQEIDEFYQQIGKLHLKELPVFFSNLKSNGNITEKQLQDLLKKFQSEKKLSSSGKLDEESSPFIHFVDLCAKKHLSKGGRITGFFGHTTSNYQDLFFVDKIASNSSLSYHEKVVKIHVPSLEVNDALLVLIQKSH